MNLQVWGTYDSRLAAVPKTPVIAGDPRLTDDIGNWTPVAVDEATPFNARPHRIRALNVMLATRSNREDQDMHLAPDIARNENRRIAADRTWFDVDGRGAGDHAGLCARHDAAGARGDPEPVDGGRPVKTRRRTGDPRGSALILAILIMLAMLGLGLMAMRTTTHAMAATGNIRLARQARLVAETGIYHVATVMNRGGLAYLQRRGDLRAPGEVVRIRFNSDGTVQYFRGTQTVAENVGAVTGTTSPVPAFLVADANRPSALGTFADGAGLVPSYFVELDGFTVLDPSRAPSARATCRPASARRTASSNTPRRGSWLGCRCPTTTSSTIAT